MSKLVVWCWVISGLYGNQELYKQLHFQDLVGGSFAWWNKGPAMTEAEPGDQVLQLVTLRKWWLTYA